MANDTIGRVICPFCKSRCDVRKNVRSKLYFMCPVDGIVQPNLPGFQDWMLENAEIYGPSGAPVDAPPPAPKSAPAPAPAPKPTPAPVPAPPPAPAPKAKPWYAPILDE